MRAALGFDGAEDLARQVWKHIKQRDEKAPSGRLIMGVFRFPALSHFSSTIQRSGNLRFIGTLLPVTCLLALSGCTSLQVKLGWKVYLAKTPIVSMQAKMLGEPGIVPGGKSALIVTVAEPDGKTLVTEGKGGGKVMWKELTVTADVVSVSSKGIVTLPKDPRISDGKVGHLTVMAPSHPDLRAELEIPVSYDFAFVSNFSGAAGTSGFDGSNGTDGTPGSMGSIDPNNPSPGGNGGDGSNGGNGDDGHRGGDAPAVQVRVAVKTESRPLLQISVAAQGKTKFYMVDPAGGSLTVKADGGAGGQGGRGGRGGSGGSGGSGTPNGNSGRSGMNGLDGSNGSPGRGGLITVTYDLAAKAYLGDIHLSSQNGPKPVFKEEAVAPLW
jgi:hypothetical protein